MNKRRSMMLLVILSAIAVSCVLAIGVTWIILRSWHVVELGRNVPIRLTIQVVDGNNRPVPKAEIYAEVIFEDTIQSPFAFMKEYRNVKNLQAETDTSGIAVLQYSNGQMLRIRSLGKDGYTWPRGKKEGKYGETVFMYVPGIDDSAPIYVDDPKAPIKYTLVKKKPPAVGNE